VDGKVLVGEDRLDEQVDTACGSDLMSDVLAYAENEAVLLTGLVNPQVIRTAEMMDIVCLVFVRGKEPTEAMIKLAEERSIVLMSTEKGMFTSCGLLYVAGLKCGDE
jgi:predicted transcriptional regulator